jgi:hypothetical protein
VAFEYAASVHARSGHTAAALTCLERAMALGYRHLEWIAGEPDFDSLRAHPRFRAIVTRDARPTPAALPRRASQPSARIITSRERH